MIVVVVVIAPPRGDAWMSCVFDDARLFVSSSHLRSYTRSVTFVVVIASIVSRAAHTRGGRLSRTSRRRLPRHLIHSSHSFVSFVRLIRLMHALGDAIARGCIHDICHVS